MVLHLLSYADDDEPIAVVPLTEEQEDAMNHVTFIQLLNKMGIKPP